MDDNKKAFRAGVFALAGIIFFAAGLIVLGLLGRKADGPLVETYFNDSVQGLEVGSSVRYRGIPIGQVEAIDLVGNRYVTTDEKAGQMVYVSFRLTNEEFKEGSRQRNLERLKELVERGLRVRLSSQGITGVGYLEINYVNPRSNPPMEIGWQPERPYVPSAPGKLTAITDAVLEVAEELRASQLSETVARANTLLDNLNKSIADANIGELSQRVTRIATRIDEGVEQMKPGELREEMIAVVRELRETIDSLEGSVNETLQATRSSLDNINERVVSEEFTGAMKGLSATADRLPETIDSMNRLVDRMDATLARNEPEMRQAVRDLRRASSNLSELSDTLKTYPSLAIFGTAPKNDIGVKP